MLAVCLSQSHKKTRLVPKGFPSVERKYLGIEISKRKTKPVKHSKGNIQTNLKRRRIKKSGECNQTKSVFGAW